MRLRLTFLKGHHQGQVLEFSSPRTLILGRSSSADVQIYDERISRRHCALKVEGDAVRLKDMTSGNGTFLNGAEVRDTVLADGDVIAIGRTEIEAKLLDEAAAGRPPSSRAPTQAAFHHQTRGGGSRTGSAVQPQPEVSCALCKNPISPAQLQLAAQHRGRYICQRCSPRVEIPGFTLEKTLGEGSMGMVYLARDQRRNIPVALKVLKIRGELSEEDRVRFSREVATSSQLEHPNIVRVLDHGSAPPYLFYVMEYVPGRSLKEWLEAHGPLPLPTVLRVSMQVALALEHARQRHIVHRDIKPENILVQQDGHAKLADFGLAKNMLTSGASGLTRPGDGLGTLPYMPPEQIENALFADHRSDIYSFGATIYHMLTGAPPFTGKTPLEYFTRIRTEQPPPVNQVRADVPQVLITMIEKAMSKQPHGRYQAVEEMRMIIQQFLRSEFDSRETAS